MFSVFARWRAGARSPKYIGGVVKLPGRNAVDVANNRWSDEDPKRRFGLFTATLLVTASMIGTGVFTTGGLLLSQLGSPYVALLAWILGGLLALAGAFSYGKLASAITENGGEYRFLSDLFHPAVGFVGGWLSLIVGFSAPIAASGLAFGTYLSRVVPAVSPVGSGVVLIVAFATLHAFRVVVTMHLHNLFTLAKLAVMLVFVVGAAWSHRGAFEANGPSSSPPLDGPSLAVALVFVSFAYSGWNGAVYLSGEIRDPARNVPRSLVWGTLLVVALYVGVNAAFLLGAPTQAIAGKIEVAHIAAEYLFGRGSGVFVSAIIALCLVSSVSAMLMAGPRVYEAMGHDYPALHFLGRRSRQGGPVVAIALQSVIAVAMLLAAAFDALLIYIGFTLSLMTMLTVVGVFVQRRRASEQAVKGTRLGNLVVPAVFILFTAWTAVYSVVERPVESLLGVGTIMVGFGLYWLVRPRGSTPSGSRPSTSSPPPG